MSTLVKEDDEYLYLYRYIHSEPDEYSKWELDSDHNEKYSEAIHIAEHGAFYEIKATYRIRKSDGQVSYDSFE